MFVGSHQTYLWLYELGVFLIYCLWISLHHFGPLLKTIIFALLHHHIICQTLKDIVTLWVFYPLSSDRLQVIKQQLCEIFLQSLGSANDKQLT